MNIYSIKDHNRELILHISGDDSHPTAPTQVGHDHYTYDANGNPILVENDSLNTERIVKSHGDLEGVYINGARRKSPSMRQRETVPNKIENTIIEQSRKLNIEKK